jgi:glucose/arabinose dehydrogenase
MSALTTIRSERGRYVFDTGAVAVALLLMFLSGCGGSNGTASSPTPGFSNIQLTRIATGLSAPLDLQQPDDNTGRLFVVEQGGTVRIVQNGALLPGAFLDITARVHMEGESGLLGLAFHPHYTQDPRFFVNYVRKLASGQLQTVIAEFRPSAADTNRADAASERQLLVVDQPFSNHKAGQLVFGADGYLYFGLGDGGSGGDPFGNGQNLQTLLGKMLRIDVDSPHGAGLAYAIPPDNPFAGGGGRPEIWAYGLRNPWRFSFDRPSGRMFIADVGQNRYEEVDLGHKGANYGWNIMEGLHCFNPPSGCDQSGLTLPIAEYDHSVGEAIIGGYLYRGAIAQLQGKYVFADLTGKVFTLTEGPPGTWIRAPLLSPGTEISALGRDGAGELYVVEISNGSLMKLVAE